MINKMQDNYIWSIEPKDVPQRLARELAALKLRSDQRNVLNKILKIVIRKNDISFNGRWISDADIQHAAFGMPPARLDELIGQINVAEERRRAKFEEQA